MINVAPLDRKELVVEGRRPAHDRGATEQGAAGKREKSEARTH
jgi:hypothetical protein